MPPVGSVATAPVIGGGAVHALVGRAMPEAPSPASSAVADTRTKDTLLEPWTRTAMLEPPAAMLGNATKPMSSNSAPFTRLSTSSAKPVTVGATIASLPS